MDQKKKDLMEKVANSMADGAKKVDGLVGKRDMLGTMTAPVVLGLILILIVAIIQSPILLVLGGLGVAVGMAPTILRKGLEAKDKIEAKKKASKAAPQETKTEEQK